MAFEEEFDIEIPDEVAEKITIVKDIVHFIHKRIYKRTNLQESIESLNEDLKDHVTDGKESVSSIANFILRRLIDILKLSRNEKFVFLLMGRTGVGKSSTINSLMGKEISKVGHFDATTMDVAFADSEINGVKFTVVDTPGLCDDVVEKGKDEEYLKKIQSKVPKIDLLWFVTALDDSRVRRDEKDGIKIITQAFGTDIWKHSIIVFTRADNVKKNYSEYLKERTKRIQDTIGEYAGIEVAKEIPAVAVTNEEEKTPDGKVWVAELYTKVFMRMSEKGTLPFFLATVERLVFSSVNALEAGQKKINLNEEQKEELKIKLLSVIPALRWVGEKVGYAVGFVLSTLTGNEEQKSISSADGASIGEYAGEKVDNWINPALINIGKLFNWEPKVTQVKCPHCGALIEFKQDYSGNWVGTTAGAAAGGGIGYVIGSGLGIAGAILGAPIAIPAGLAVAAVGAVIGSMAGDKIAGKKGKCSSCGKDIHFN